MQSMLRIAAVLCVLILSACGSSTTAPSGISEVCGGYPDWRTSDFVLPYAVGTSYAVIQGNCSGYGHSGVYKYSYDFNMAIGTPVTAARDGVVFQIRTGFANGDLTPGHENFVKIQHSDGLISAYSHLSQVLVAEGDLIRAGQVVGLSGNTGNTGNVPHLHFHVSTCSEPADCGTVPVTFRNTTPNPDGLLVSHVYPAFAYQ
jgi:murein DD-endopeptidase MepM/ murein hydrolase activator NlpD